MYWKLYVIYFGKIFMLEYLINELLYVKNVKIFCIFLNGL